MTNQELAIAFFLILAIVLIFIRIVGYIAKKLGQTQVVSEMITGVILGPSLLGMLLPDMHAAIFTKEAVSVVYCVSQMGLVLYMFLIGTEFNTELIFRRFKSAVIVSSAGILTPFLLGGILAYFISGDTVFFSPDASIPEAILFTGAAMSITAFPMLARIIHEKGLAGTELGTLALAAGSIDDAAAWCLLAITIASFNGDSRIALMAIGGGILYALTVLGIGKPLLNKVTKGKRVSPQVLSIILSLVMLGAFFTDYIGIYAVFGAFIMGIAMPKGTIAKELGRILEPLTETLLLPLFFIYSGLNTKFDLIFSPRMLLITLIVIIIACLGKGLACWAAARMFMGRGSEAAVIGTLMNARGLMELILLNIGLERRVITQTFYTMMVIMAIVTTLIASPVFEYIHRKNAVNFKKSLTIPETEDGVST